MSFSIIAMKKESGLTSFQSLGAVKKAYRGEKVGHTGTLDRFASGLMIVLTGEATKLNPLFSGFDKSYRAEMVFGRETATLDPEGEVVQTSERIPTLEEIEAVLPRFLGEQKQVPPVYSAIHVGGKRAYQEARKGREVEMEARDVTISSLSIISYNAPYLVFDCSVSKGTYIRSLARDIAKELGSCGHLVNLERYRVGPYSYNNVGTIPESAEKSEENLALVVPSSLTVSASALFKIANGYFPPARIGNIMGEGPLYRVYCEDEFIGVVERMEDCSYRIAALVDRENLQLRHSSREKGN